MAVDDEPDLCALTKEFLEMAEDMEVDTASSVREAMGVLAKKHYDAIVSDYQMPKEDGIQFLKSLRQKENMIPFILFTGKGREEIVIEALNSGADSYMQKGGKPTPMYTELGHRIRETVRRYQADKAVELKKMELQRANEELSTANSEISLQAEELLRANLALEGSRDKYIDLYDFAPIGYITLTEKAVISEVNLTGALLLNIVRSKLVKSRFRNFIAEKDFNQWYRYFKNVLDQEEKQTCTLTLRRGDGSEFPARLESIQIPDNINGGRMVRMAISDVTDSEKLEEALRKSENYFSTLVENNPDMIVRFNPDLRHTYCNLSVEKQFGLPRESFIGKRFQDLGGSLEQYRAMQALLEKALRTGEEQQTDQFFELPLGRKYFHTRIIPERDGNGTVESLLAITHDTTIRIRAERALQDSEEQYRAIFDRSPIAIELYDAQGVLKHANASCLKLFGVERTQDLQDFSLFADPNISDEQKEKLHRGEYVGYQGHFDLEKVRALNLYHISRKGIIWLDILITPLKKSDGSIMGFLVQIQDITARKRAEGLLVHAKEQLQLAIEGSGIGLWDWNVQTGETVFNERWAAIVGYTLQELSPISIETWTRLVHPSDLQRSNELLAEHFAGNTASYDCEARMKHKDGRWIWVLDRGKVSAWDAQGRPTRMSGTHTDITERKRDEETLREKEAKYRDYVENSPIGVFICDEKGRYLDVNSAATTITGYTREELLELSIPDILPPESLELVSRLFKLVSETGRTTAEFAFRRKDGSIGTWSLEGVRLSPTRLMGLTTDITERKRVENALRVSEERFSGLVDQSPLSIQILEPSGKTVQVNRAFEKLWGVSFEQMRDYNILEDEQFEDLNIRSYLKKAFSGDPVDYPPVKFTPKAGSVVGHERLVQAIAYPIRDGSGAVREVTLIHQDITELKHAENALREANRKLNLLSSITRHDINNQLMALSGNLTLLERKYPDIAGDKTLHMIEVAAERISAMIRFTKEYEDIGTHHSQWQDVRELVSNASNGIALGQVHLVNDIPSGAEIFADPLIQKVFYNLMDNSVRHGGRITTISISVEGSGDDHLIVCEDDGDGVIEGEKEIIFNRCFGKNTGLGLALSREILAITGITIRENGEPNKGARFEMSVPKGGYRIKTAG